MCQSAGLTTFLAVGHAAFADPEVVTVQGHCFDDAAIKAARAILENQDTDFDDVIYVDAVTNASLEYRQCYAFELDELR
ncbi:hypothetical protein [Enterovibrio paralichthyis]|uniref:hypothetical protein n=1 Tax=Enterovibrio paralichthyis TaxID=2853805 RepID=UPI001C4443DE|nr:hypothetical protein [Enterovibrio paralichthyis]MBV7300214.1 hypothetical protein [Enterovibrio paralichthyis]